ncbi:MAG: sulfatase arylsulfatase, partial [Planctomycetes bacterium]|nr:sulfatase arylsulfatase [Planctomycetota bacterium]
MRSTRPSNVNHKKNINRRDFIKKTVHTGAAASLAPYIITGCSSNNNLSKQKKVIIVGIDGMDPQLTEQMMDSGDLPNFNRLRQKGGYSPLATTLPPQSPVAWAGFITGANSGVHGIYDFVHRKPQHQSRLFSSFCEAVPASDALQIGSQKVPLTFWPFNHQPAYTKLNRQGTPFWDYLDEKNINSQIYLVPSNYPPSPSKHGNHQSLAGMGVPDLTGNRGMYQFFSENGPTTPKYQGNGWLDRLVFENHSAHARLIGPPNQFLESPESIFIEFSVHRDLNRYSAAIDVQNQKILLNAGQWSSWIKLNFDLSTPLAPDKRITGICRFFLKQVSPNFQLYISPINIDPSDPAMQISEPANLSKKMTEKMGLFYTLGFQEDYNARIFNALNDQEFAQQAQLVLDQRLKMLDYAFDHYDDGVLFFYFSSTDMQSHIFWCDSSGPHPFRSTQQSNYYHNHIKDLYIQMDNVLGDIIARYDKDSTIIILSDHGFGNLNQNFNLNRWLRDNNYINPVNATSLEKDVDWDGSQAFALGINGLYINQKDRERDGIVNAGQEKEVLINELIEKLENVRDTEGKPIIDNVFRADQVYHGEALDLAPDLIIGYNRGCRCDYGSSIGLMQNDLISKNTNPWGADHCFTP